MKPRSAITILLICTTAGCTPSAPTRAAGAQAEPPKSAPGRVLTHDGQLRHAVKDVLRADPALDGALIAVSARDGEVTLAGVVVSSEQRFRAQQLTAATRGVREVDNVLEVEPVR